MIINEDFFDKEEYERLCEECSLKMKFEKIDLMDEQENYIRLNNVRYGLPVDVYLDESNAHASYGHEVIMFFRNSYNDKMHVFVAMSVSNNPIILTDDKINIHNNDVNRIRRWVIKYRDWIIALAECRIRYQTFSDRIAKYHENKRQLNEMMEYDLQNYGEKDARSSASHSVTLNTVPHGKFQNYNAIFYSILDGDVTNYPTSNEYNEPNETSDIRWIPMSKLDEYKFAFNQAPIIKYLYDKFVRVCWFKKMLIRLSDWLDGYVGKKYLAL